MAKANTPQESGELVINGHRMNHRMRRTRGESAFGIRGSRIFELEIRKDGQTSGKYDRGWIQRIQDEDEETTLYLNYLIGKYGKAKAIKRKE